MSSSLPQLLGNYITHNRMYGMALFCRKDPEPGVGREAGERGADRDGDRGGVGGENLNEEGELSVWENDLDSEDERVSARRPISVALIESNCMSHNGGYGSFFYYYREASLKWGKGVCAYSDPYLCLCSGRSLCEDL